jgi:hypothetical protein
LISFLVKEELKASRSSWLVPPIILGILSIISMVESPLDVLPVLMILFVFYSYFELYNSPNFKQLLSVMPIPAKSFVHSSFIIATMWSFYFITLYSCVAFIVFRSSTIHIGDVTYSIVLLIPAALCISAIKIYQTVVHNGTLPTVYFLGYYFFIIFLTALLYYFIVQSSLIVALITIAGYYIILTIGFVFYYKRALQNAQKLYQFVKGEYDPDFIETIELEQGK